MSDKRIVVLAFSGGLDTSYCVKYLSEVCGHAVHTVTVNVGGFSQAELDDAEKRARELGATEHRTIDVTEEFYRDCIRYLVFGNVLRGNVYPLSVSAERSFQARAVARYTASVRAPFIAHGSTGAGNDQIRFDTMFHILLPDVEILTPIRDQRLSREEEIDFLRAHGYEQDWLKAAYSINKGLWGTSVGGRETLTSHEFLPDDVFPTPVTKSSEERVTLHFTRGELTGIDYDRDMHPVDAIRRLHEIAQPFGIGRDVHVGDTIVGMKGRVGLEAAAPLIIIKAHHTLEKHVLSKQQLLLKEQLASVYGSFVHEALFLEPAARDIERFFESTQAAVTGSVFVALTPYRFQVLGIQSPHDLMNSAFGAYGEMNNTISGDDARGFSKVLATPMMIYYRTNPEDER